MKTKLNIIFCLMLLIFMSSCGFNKTFFSSKKVDKLNKVALISTFIQFAPPTDNGLYTTIFNEKINSISKELNLLFKDYATSYRDSIGRIISKNYNCEVLYGESLQSNPGFLKLKTEYNYPSALATYNAMFPLVFLSSGDINPFKDLAGIKINKPDTTISLVEKKTIQDICSILNVDFIAVSYTNIIAMSGNAYYKGYLQLFTYFGIFDKDGDLIAWGNKIGDFDRMNAGKIEKYPPMLNSFYVAIKPMLSEIYRKYSTK